MFFILSKILQFLVYTLPLLFLSLGAIFVFYNRKHTRRWLLVLLVVLYVLSVPYTSNRVLSWLEMPRPSPDRLKPHYDVIVVLTGMVNLELSGRGHIEFGEGVDRILTGISLIKQGVGDKLLISGGNGSLFDRRTSEAEMLKGFAIEFGLSPDQIITERTSRNTYENALNSAKLIREYNYQDVLLVTSSYHMRRSLGVFHKQGIYPDAYPTDFMASPIITPFSFIPSAGSLHTIDLVLHELVGLLMYRLQGYL